MMKSVFYKRSTLALAALFLSVFAISIAANEGEKTFLSQCGKINIGGHTFPGPIHFGMTEEEITSIYGDNYTSGYFEGAELVRYDYAMYDDYTFFFKGSLVMIAIRDKNEKICNTRVGSTLDEVRAIFARPPVFDGFEDELEDEAEVEAEVEDEGNLAVEDEVDGGPEDEFEDELEGSPEDREDRLWVLKYFMGDYWVEYYSDRKDGEVFAIEISALP